MSRICLYLSESSPVELLEFRFSNERLSANTRLVRGRTAGAYKGAETFLWTPAVRALCLLLIRSKASSISGESTAILRGLKGSFAAALDHAINKPPKWLVEMFGWDRQGGLIYRKLFLRTNPGQKQPGEVSVALNSRQVPLDSVFIFRGTREITELSELREIAWAIDPSKIVVSDNCQKSTSDNIQDTSTKSSVLDNSTFFSALRSSFNQELVSLLSNTETFFPKRHKAYLDNIATNPSFLQVAGNQGKEKLAAISTDLPGRVRLGECDENELRRELCQEQPVTVCATGVQIGSLALLTYLNKVKGYNISINYRFPYAVELVKRIIERDFYEMPDLCAAGIGPAATLMNSRSTEYKPLMFAPEISHRILAPKRNDESNRTKSESRRFLFAADDPTSASFYFEDLHRRGILGDKLLSVSHVEPDEATMMLREAESDIRSIQWFPHYTVQELLNGATLVDDPTDSATKQPTILFASDSFRKNRSKCFAFEAALRNAWLELRASSSARTAAIELLLGDKAYVRFLSRFTGLHEVESSRAFEADIGRSNIHHTGAQL